MKEKQYWLAILQKAKAQILAELRFTVCSDPKPHIEAFWKVSDALQYLANDGRWES